MAEKDPEQVIAGCRPISESKFVVVYETHDETLRAKNAVVNQAADRRIYMSVAHYRHTSQPIDGDVVVLKKEMDSGQLKVTLQSTVYLKPADFSSSE